MKARTGTRKLGKVVAGALITLLAVAVLLPVKAAAEGDLDRKVLTMAARSSLKALKEEIKLIEQTFQTNLDSLERSLESGSINFAEYLAERGRLMALTDLKLKALKSQYTIMFSRGIDIAGSGAGRGSAKESTTSLSRDLNLGCNGVYDKYVRCLEGAIGKAVDSAGKTLARNNGLHQEYDFSENVHQSRPVAGWVPPVSNLGDSEHVSIEGILSGSSSDPGNAAPGTVWGFANPSRDLPEVLAYDTFGYPCGEATVKWLTGLPGGWVATFPTPSCGYGSCFGQGNYTFKASQGKASRLQGYGFPRHWKITCPIQKRGIRDKSKRLKGFIKQAQDQYNDTTRELWRSFQEHADSLLDDYSTGKATLVEILDSLSQLYTGLQHHAYEAAKVAVDSVEQSVVKANFDFIPVDKDWNPIGRGMIGKFNCYINVQHAKLLRNLVVFNNKAVGIIRKKDKDGNINVIIVVTQTFIVVQATPRVVPPPIPPNKKTVPLTISWVGYMSTRTPVSGCPSALFRAGGTADADNGAVTVTLYMVKADGSLAQVKQEKVMPTDSDSWRASFTGKLTPGEYVVKATQAGAFAEKSITIP